MFVLEVGPTPVNAVEERIYLIYNSVPFFFFLPVMATNKLWVYFAQRHLLALSLSLLSLPQANTPRGQTRSVGAAGHQVTPAKEVVSH